LRPDELLKDIAGLIPGMICVDLGSGTGVFSSRMVEIVGPDGLVYAVDNSAAMLDYLRSSNPPANLKLIQADASSTGLDNECADVCLAALILHEVDSPEKIIAETYRLLKPGSPAVLIEWKMNTSHGPPRSIRIDPDKARALFQQAGLIFENQVDWSANYYVITARKPL